MGLKVRISIKTLQQREKEEARTQKPVNVVRVELGDAISERKPLEGAGEKPPIKKEKIMTTDETGEEKKETAQERVAGGREAEKNEVEERVVAGERRQEKEGERPVAGERGEEKKEVEESSGTWWSPIVSLVKKIRSKMKR